MKFQKIRVYCFILILGAVILSPQALGVADYGDIAGTLTNTNGGPAKNVCVEAYTPDGLQTLYSTTSQSDGSYYMYAEPGDYKVFFKTDGNSCGFSEYVEEWYNDKAELGLADVVTVTAGNITAGIDAILTYNGKIFGKLTYSNGWPLENACVDLYDNQYVSDGNYQQYFLETAQTDAGGNYEFTELAPDTYKLHFRDCDETSYQVIPEWYDEQSYYQSSDSVGVIYNGGIAHRRVDENLKLQSVIEGIITNTDEELVSGICVDAYDSSSFTNKVGEALSDANGKYVIPDLKSGIWAFYYMLYYDCNEPRIHLSGREYGIKLKTAGTHFVRDIQILRESTISGRVTDSNGNPVPFIDVRVEGRYTIGGSTQTDIDGYYTVHNINPSTSGNGPYTVSFCTRCTRYAKVSYPETFLISTDNTHINGVNAQLYMPNSIAGKVVDKDGNILQNMRVELYRDDVFMTSRHTNYYGNYRFGDLEPGDYKLHFVDLGYGYSWYGNYREAGTYQDHWYERKNTLEKATMLRLGENQDEVVNTMMLLWGNYFTTPVEIDIKPGNDDNVVSCTNPRGIIPVAIVTTDDFDATSVNPFSVEFGPNGAGVVHSKAKHVEDVNGDGRDDLMLHFRFGETNLTCESLTGEIYGMTVDDEDISGTDTIKMLNPKN